jgi:preflagellin peptidase FlaK
MSQSLLTLDMLRTGVALAMLGYGSFRDLRTREVHDLLWVAGGGAGLVLDAYEMFLGTLTVRQLVLSVGFMAAVGLVLGYLRLFGGADILAFVALSVIHPRAPVYLQIYWGWAPPFYPFTLVSNTAVAGIVTPLVALAHNLGAAGGGADLFERHRDVSALRKAALMFTAVNVRLGDVRGPPFQYPLEDPIDGSVKLRPDIWDDDEAQRVFRLLRDRGVGRVWVSATLPYLVIVTVGYVLSVVFGDVLLWLFIVS